MGNEEYYNIHFKNGDVKKLVHEDDIAKLKKAWDEGEEAYVWIRGLELVCLEEITFISISSDE